MRFLSLDLVAFGPFSGAHLDLSQGNQGLQVIAAPNEGGKSTSLRALRALLYGVPETTRDDFLHAKNELRVAASLRNAAGQELGVLRRKGRKGTLLSVPDEEPLPDEILAPFLGGVDEATFTTFFGIDHERLRAGGEEILRERGAVGEALFGAGLGGLGVHDLLARLDAEAKELFAPTGRKPLVNEALSRWKSLSDELRKASLSARDWERAAAELSALEKKVRGVSDRLAHAQRAKTRAERLRRVLPLLAERRELLRAVGELGELPAVGADFVPAREKVLTEQRKRQGLREAAATQHGRRQEERDEIALHPELSGWFEEIDALAEQLGAQEKALGDSRGLVESRDELRRQALELVAELRPDVAPAGIETLRPALGRDEELQELGRQAQGLVKAVTDAQGASQEALDEERENREALANAPARRDPTALKLAVAAARRSAGIDDQVLEREATGRDLAQRVAALAGGLQLPGPEGGFAALVLPLRETLEALRDEEEGLRLAVKECQTRLDEATQDARRAQQELDALRHAGEVPSEEDLATAREARTRTWEGLTGAWRAGAPADEPGIERFEGEVGHADTMADRLRREAERVHQQARLRADLDHGSALAGTLAERLASLEADRHRWSKRWQGLWAPLGVEAQAPRAMESWLTKAESLREKAGELARERAAAEALASRRATLVEGLIQALASLGEPRPDLGPALADALEEAQSVLAAVEEQDQAIAGWRDAVSVLAARREEAEKALGTAQEALAQWRRRWGEVVAPLGLDDTATPTVASGAMKRLRQAFDKLGEASGLDARVRRIRADYDAFAKKVHEICQAVEPGTAAQTPVHAARHLRDRVALERQARTRRETLDRQVRKLAEEIAGHGAALAGFEVELAALRREAGCADEEALSAVVDRLARRAALQDKLEEVERRLAEGGDGVALAQLEAEAADADPDALPGEISRLGEEVARIEQARLDLVGELGAKRDAFGKLDGAETAARLEEERQAVQAHLARGVRRYARVRLASALLGAAIESFRERNEGPMLAVASRRFAELSLGSFSGLRVDHRAEPAVLVGVRPSGAWVPVQDMSDGARDQLFLALRLAAVTQRLEQGGEPMPFIVDDILVNFDDDRTEATLRVLAEVAEQTQVVLFTHHAHVVATAQRVAGPAGVYVHGLAAA